MVQHPLRDGVQDQLDIFEVARREYNQEVATEVNSLLKEIETLTERLGGKFDDKALIAAVVVLTREILRVQDWIIQFKVG